MTGCYPPRVSHATNQLPSSREGLHPAEITVAEILKGAGYATKHIGKWHLGDAKPFLPTSQGFDSYFGIPYSNDMWRYHPKMPIQENEDELMKTMRKRAAYTGFAGQGSYYKPDELLDNDLALYRNEEKIESNPDQRQLTTRYTSEALQFIESNKDNPFFLYLAYSMPHVPLFVSDKHRGKSPRGLYGDVIMEIDWSTGQILDKLKALNIDEKTLVVFTSDNGPWGSYGIDGGSAGPLRGSKGSTFEGGMRVPAIFRWPEKIPGGKRCDAIAGTLDLLPTFARVAGAEAPADRVIDGKSLLPLISGETNESPHEYFYYFSGGKVRLLGIRDQRWKLHVKIDEGVVRETELYDLGRDVAEKFNRIVDHPDIAKKLKSQAQRFYDEISRNVRPIGRLP
jgi:arylsulfatase A